MHDDIFLDNFSSYCFNLASKQNIKLQLIHFLPNVNIIQYDSNINKQQIRTKLNIYSQLHMPEVAMLVETLPLLPEGTYCFTTQS
jgi:hypothetical protein